MSSLSGTSKQSFVLLELRHGDPAAPTYQRYTDQNSDVAALGAQWSSRPDMSVRVPPNVGMLADKALEVTMKVEAGFLDQVSSGEPHSPVRVRLMEAHAPAGGAEVLEVTHLFRGWLSKAKRNPGGQTESVLLTCATARSRMDVDLGIPATHLCQWTFGGRGCFLDLDTVDEQGTLTAVSGVDATVTGLADHSADPTGRYWHKGYLEVDGLRITVRDWQQSAPTLFRLAKPPPARWVGATVRAVPGCDKSVATCRDRWNREQFFSGIGMAIPAYHPAFESPT